MDLCTKLNVALSDLLLFNHACRADKVTPCFTNQTYNLGMAEEGTWQPSIPRCSIIQGPNDTRNMGKFMQAILMGCQTKFYNAVMCACHTTVSNQLKRRIWQCLDKSSPHEI